MSPVLVAAYLYHAKINSADEHLSHISDALVMGNAQHAETRICQLYAERYMENPDVGVRAAWDFRLKLQMAKDATKSKIK